MTAGTLHAARYAGEVVIVARFVAVAQAHPVADASLWFAP